MATTRTDIVQKTFRIPLIGNFQNRSGSGSKDQRFINCFPESKKNEITENKKIYLIKRSGLSLYHAFTAGEGRGNFYFKGHLFTVIDSNVYRDFVSIITLTTSTGFVGFTEATDASGSVLFMHDGAFGYVIYSDGTYVKLPATYPAWQATHAYVVGDIVIPTVDNGFSYKVTVAGTSGGAAPTWPTTVGNTVVNGTVTFECFGYYDVAGMPKDALPYPQYLDGRVYLIAKRSDGTNSNAIYCSDIDNPLSWDSTAFTTAEMFPDELQSLSKQNNMLVALGQNSTEFYYDSGSTTTGNPITRNESLALQVGCAAPKAVISNEKFLLFIGNSDLGGKAVWMLDGFSPKKVSDEATERVLNAEGSAIANAEGYGVRTQGHFFYVFNLISQSRTLVYDLEERIWHEWSTNSSGTHTVFKCLSATDDGTGRSLLLSRATGHVLYLDENTYQDNGTSILAEVITTKLDFETMNRKSMSNISIIGDLVSDSITLRWTDDDYQTWSNWKVISLSSRPIFFRCGMFRRRAFNLLFTGNNPLRLESIEMDIILGTH